MCIKTNRACCMKSGWLHAWQFFLLYRPNVSSKAPQLSKSFNDTNQSEETFRSAFLHPKLYFVRPFSRLLSNLEVYRATFIKKNVVFELGKSRLIHKSYPLALIQEVFIHLFFVHIYLLECKELYIFFFVNC